MKSALSCKEEITCSKNITFYYTCSIAMDITIAGGGKKKINEIYNLHSQHTSGFSKKGHIKAILLPTKTNHYFLRFP